MQRRIRRNYRRMMRQAFKRNVIGSSYHPHPVSFVLNPAGYEHAYGYCRYCGRANKAKPQPK